jgi:branched-chain amino acid transport system permease protein/urea transport system permease protein
MLAGMTSGTKIALLCWVGVGVAPLLLDGWGISQVAQYMTYGIFAMSLSFVWGQAGILCFGQAIFFGIGAYLMALTMLDKIPHVAGYQSAGIALAIVVPAAVGHVFGRILFGGRGLSGAFFAIVTLCAAVIAEVVAQHWRYIGGFNGLFGVPPLRFPGENGAYLDPLQTYFLVALISFGVFVLLAFLIRSPFGTILTAIRGDENRTAQFGYDTARFKVLAFTISAAIAGLAGALFTVQFGFVSPALIGFALSTEVLIWTAVGGRMAPMAAFLGAITVRGVESVLSDSLGTYWLMALGVFFVVTVVFAPQGLFGSLLTWRRK